MHVSGYSRLVATVAAMTAVIPSVEAFIGDVVDKLRAADAGADVDLGALADELEGDTQRLSHAIVANTPAASDNTGLQPEVLAEVIKASESQTATDNGTSAAQVEGAMTTTDGANTTQDSQLTSTAQVDPASLGDGSGQGMIDPPNQAEWAAPPASDVAQPQPPVNDANGGDSAPTDPVPPEVVPDAE